MGRMDMPSMGWWEGGVMTMLARRPPLPLAGGLGWLVGEVGWCWWRPNRGGPSAA